MSDVESNDRIAPGAMTAITKRRFLAGLGGAAALVSLHRTGVAAPGEPVYDAIIVGGGTTGIPAAIFAAKRGLKVLVIDPAGVLGGTLYLSGGMMAAAGTKLQKSRGVLNDSPQIHYDDIMRHSKGTADPAIVRLAVFNAAETVDWLTDSGLEIPPEYPIFGPPHHDPYSIARYATGPKGGRSIVATLLQEIQPHIDSGAVTLRLQTEVTELVQEPSGRVIGVIAKGENGQPQRFLGRNVALTSGGYAANAEMIQKLEGRIKYCDMSYPYSQGIGVTLGLAAGGYLRGGEKHLALFGAVLANDDYPSRVVGLVRHWAGDRPPWEIMVNTRGERFHQEDRPDFDIQEHALAKQPDERCWAVFDQTIFDQAPALLKGARWPREEVVKAFETGTPMFYRAESLADLAQAAGVDGNGLARTVAAYNEAQAAGKDPLFGRTFMPKPIVNPPFYALRLQGYLLTTFAGLGVNSELQVVRKNGTPISGLYAAGELLGTGQLMGNSYCGGMTVTPSLTFGRLLGQKFMQFKT
jgi:fumarate reductase flavoprotein subunit